MNSKDYSYYPPKKPQFFFPKKEFNQFKGYYTPFSFKSKLLWIFYTNSSIIRSLYTVKEDDIPLPISEIKKTVGLKNATYFYNIGTEGIEQKATIIASNKTQKRFIKFAQKTKAKQLVENESKTLFFLNKKNELNTAKILNSHSSDSSCHIVTEVINGEKINFTNVNQQILLLLFQVSKLDEKTQELKHVFSHGDFCPWNMLLNKQQQIVLIDWEMAGLNPLGYDLFTFIFQTSFLLKPKLKINKIIYKNTIHINKYFNHFQIKDWKKYLIKFAKIKVEEEKEKSNSLLLLRYEELLKEI